MSARLPDSERVLVLAPLGRDAELTCKLLVKHGFEAFSCANVEEFFLQLDRGAGCVLVTQESLVHRLRSRLAALLGTQPPWSDLPVLLLTTNRNSLKPPLTGMHELGNVTLLERPLTAETLLAAVSASLRGRRRQYEACAAIYQRDQFLAMLGHELRNPLGAIMLASDSVVGVGAEELRTRLSVISRQATHLSHLVGDLLDVARVTSGKVELRMEPLALDALVRHSISTLEAFARQHEVTVRFAPSGDAYVDGDPVRVEQILSNLIANAIKYSPGGHQVTVSTSVVEGTCELRVKDQGVGIAPEMQARIFELFAQAEGSLDRGGGGMGIGLTLARRLIEQHHGTVEVHSEGLGHGSEFVVRLPRCASTPTPAPAPPAVVVVPAVRGRRLCVVLVDDNEDLRELARMALERMDCAVEDAADGIEGLERILQSRPDVAFIDIGLPGMDGFSVAREVRAQLGAGPLLVAITGYGQPQDRARALDSGFDVHLTKPVSTAALRELVERTRNTRGPQPARG